MTEAVLLASAALIGSSGVLGLLWPRESPAGQRFSSAAYLVGAVAALAATLGGLYVQAGRGVRLPWPPHAGAFVVADPIALVFLVPLLVVGAMGSLFGTEYWSTAHKPATARRLRLFYGLMTSGMMILVLARHSYLFLIGWELMAIPAFFCVQTEDHLPEAREAGWIYLVSTHTGTLLLFGLFGLMAAATGSFEFRPLPTGLDPGLRDRLFLLALGAFGLKAGLMPLHFWLPPAHAAAPSHVSAFMSGVLIKMGVYGMVRFTSLLGTPPAWWGELVFALGAFSGIAGVLFAIGQHDLKRLLAYHSVENIGIIFMGLGLALVGRARGNMTWELLGLSACLLHVWNHGLFKSLLFLSAGSVIHAAHTRDIDHLGGLGRRMPVTAFYFALGAVAICGLPPLNGFVSEFILYLGMFRAAGTSATAAWHGGLWGPAALALIGTLALACFVKCLGAIFLGEPRSDHGREAHECGTRMRLPMGVLAGCCLAVGLLPALAVRPLQAAAAAWAGAGESTMPRLSAQFDPWVLGGVSLVVLCLCLGVLRLLARRVSPAEGPPVGTWDCGYARPSATMQYTASSFGDMLVQYFRWLLLPREEQPTVAGPFPDRTAFASTVPDAMLDRALTPTFKGSAWLLGWARAAQFGHSQLYVFYILATVLGLLYWIGRPIGP